MLDKIKLIAIAAIASACLWLGPGAGQAGAEGFAIYDYGARGSSLGGAMVARTPDPSAVAHNAALLTGLPGTRAMAGITFIATKGDIYWRQGGLSGRTGAKSAVYPIPHAYFTRQLGERWFFGVGEFSRFGLGNKYPSDWPGRFNTYDIYLQSLSLNPSVAWKATGGLSVGFGLELMHASLSMRKRTQVGPFEVDANLRKAKDLALGFNLGLHQRFGERWAAGIQYRSPVRIKAKGTMDFSYVGPDIPAYVAGYESMFHDGEVKGTVTLPESVSAGVAFTPVPALNLELGAIWTRWSRYRTLEFSLPGALPNEITPKNWKDAWRVVFGVEYAVRDWLDLRLGYNFTESPMTDEYADYSVPTKDRHTYTVGLGFHNDAMSLDVGYVFVDCLTRSYSGNPATGTVDSDAKGFVANELAMSFTYNF